MTGSAVSTTTYNSISSKPYSKKVQKVNQITEPLHTQTPKKTIPPTAQSNQLTYALKNKTIPDSD